MAIHMQSNNMHAARQTHSSGLNIIRKLSRRLGLISGQIRARVAASFKTFLSIISTSMACSVMGNESTDSFVAGLREHREQSWKKNARNKRHATHLSANSQGPSAFLPHEFTADTTCLSCTAAVNEHMPGTVSTAL
jgi:hypothetical protein